MNNAQTIVKVKYSSNHRHTQENCFPDWFERRDKKRKLKYNKNDHYFHCNEIKREILEDFNNYDNLNFKF